jgi:hypothetical protein
MRIFRTVVLALAMVAPVAATHADPRSEKEKKGALKEQQDPAKDLKLQKENLEKLQENAAADRKAGNRAGAWAAEGDAKHVKKLIEKDEKLIEKHEKKQPNEETKSK